MFVLLSAAALLPTNSATGQMSQQEYLKQQAAALKNQMMRAQIEQAASPNFAEEAYKAQQTYLMETADKSFRIGKPETSASYRVSGQATHYQSRPAMPPVHVAPTRHSVPPEWSTAALPNPAEFSDQGESISGPTNRVGLQDRLVDYLAHPKYRTQNPPRNQRVAGQRQVRQQPLFTPEQHTAAAPEPFQQNVQSFEQNAYERMAAAIDEREVDRTVTYIDDSSTEDIVHVSTRLQQPSTQRINSPSPRGRHASKVSMAKQVSVLNRTSQQTSDSNRLGSNSKILVSSQRSDSAQQADSDSSSNIDSLRRPGPAQIDEEKEELKRRLKELENEAEEQQTRRRERDLDREERLSRIRSERDDLRREATEDSNEPDGDNRPARLSCEEFRTNLLNQSIRDISLDLSPRASRIRDQYIAISRSWTDQLGNVIATGAMVDLRRGYVIIDGINGRQKVPFSKLSDADSSAVSEYWQIPELCSVGDDRLPQRNWVPQSFTWTASSLCHKPLYFENQQLERYGHTHGPILQPIHSTAHFFVSLATLPYQTAIHPPNECRYALGYYRPGNCAPWLKDPIPLSLDGLRRQALVTTGLAFIP